VTDVNVDELIKGTHDALAARRVYGDLIERDGVTVIPVAAFRGGGGGGSDAERNGGGGFGVQARAVGVYVIKDGRVWFEPALDITSVAMAGLIALAVIAFVWRPRRRERR
jgi:uncharacterized spore protein YtfJ